MSKDSIRRTIVFTGALAVAFVSSALAQEPTATERQRDAQPERQTSAQAERQTNAQSDERRTVGTVSSVGRGSIVVRTDQGRYMVYAIGSGTARARQINPGDRVSVVTLSSDTDEAPTALSISVLPRAQGLAAPAAGAEEADNVPQQVRTLEAQIERQARRYRAGVSAGAALDPELISLDAFATFGPLFNRNINFRPNLEFAFGELTTLFGIHLDAIYTLPGVSRSIKWAPYVGAGPTFSFSHQGFEGDSSNAEINTTNGSVNVDNGRFDFSNYEWHNGVNFIVGARSPGGKFFEMKSTAWGAANIRLLGGFEF